MQTRWTVEHLFAAKKTQIIGEQREATGIWKTPLAQADVTSLGIEGDIQVDTRFHGGVNKALHQYALKSYALLQQAFPHLSTQLIAGSMGENLSAAGMSEDTVHMGDIFRMGGVLVQIAEPRSPCWKINSKFGEPRLAKAIAEQAISGWYYRVLETGTLKIGDSIQLVERPNPVSMSEFLQIYAEHRPSLDAMQRLAQCQGLSPLWQNKVQQRLQFLSQLNLSV